MNRREFLGAGAAGLALTGIGNIPVVFGNVKPKRVGLIGCGWYGKSALLRLIQIEPVEIVAICDVDSKMAAEAAALIASRQKSGKKPRTYGDYRQMLRQEKFDIVQVSTPDHWHAMAMIAAVKAGADVYVDSGEPGIRGDIVEGHMPAPELHLRL